MLQVSFQEDPFRKNGKTISRVVQRETVPFSDVVSYMSRGTSATVNDMTSVMNHFKDALVYFISAGRNVQTPWGTYNLSPRRNDTSVRNVDKTNFVIRLRPNTEVADEIRNQLQVEVVDTPPLRIPLIYSVHNADTGEDSSTGKSGDLILLSGSRLSFKSSNLDEGVFWVNEAGEALRSSIYGKLGGTSVICKIPEIPPGSYQLAVRTKPSKTSREGVWETPFLIQA